MKALLLRRPRDHFQKGVQLFPDPLHQPVQQQPGPVLVLDVGGVNHHLQQVAQGVYGNMPLAALDLLASVITPHGRWHGEKTPEAPDYFTPEETSALVAANPIYPVRMAMRIMLRTWLRVSECLSLCPADPPIISLRPEVTGNKVKRGREVHIPDDLVECLEDLVL